ncbi:MAG: sensor histidine kinase [Silanimonas lenta]
MSASLQGRLWRAAALPTLALAACGLLLLQLAFAHAVERAFDARLSRSLDAAVAGLRADADGRLVLRRRPAATEFERVHSGWYWQVRDGEGRILRSRSLWDLELPPLEGPPDGTVQHRDLEGLPPGPLRVAVRTVVMTGGIAQATVIVAGPRAEIDEEVEAFAQLLWLGGAGFVALALLAIGVQLRLGLAPLRAFGRQLVELAAGQRELPGPVGVRELDEVAGELREVLEQNHRLAEAGRKLAGDLAHAIKTPLALLRSRIPRDAGAERAALDRIDEVVDRHLARASAEARRRRSRCAPRAEAVQLAALLGQLHPGKQLRLAPGGGGLEAACEASDLQEMLGNLLDNALRAARGEVHLAVESEDGGVRLRIDDDGPGLDGEALQRLGERGLRFDQQQPGTGLGVSISRDIAESYGGRLEFGRSPLGGLQARLWLPAPPLLPGRRPGRPD